MDNLVLLIFYAILFLIVIVYAASLVLIKRNRRLNIPYVKGLPIIGVLFSLKTTRFLFYHELSKKYGGLFCVKFGLRDIYVISKYENLKAIIKSHNEPLSGRMNSKAWQQVSHDSGIVSQSGSKFKLHKSFILKTLKDFGVGKDLSHEIIRGQCNELLDQIKNTNSQSVDFGNLINLSTLNIISEFIMSYKFTKDDESFKEITKLIDSEVRNISIFRSLISLFPFLYSSEWFGYLMNVIWKFNGKFNRSFDIIRRQIREHKKRMDKENFEVQDLMDSHLEMQATDPELFTDDQLVVEGLEMLIAGYDTTSTTLIWSLIYLSKDEDIQMKMYHEIKNLSVDFVCWNDRFNMPYCRAVVDEISRFSSVATLGIPHLTLSEIETDAYRIPKDELVLINFYSINHDDEVWEKPNEFYPEHFLTTSNGSDVEYRNREELVNFGLGKRKCLGEILARMEVFVFLMNIIREYRVRFDRNWSDEEFKRLTLGSDGFISFPGIQNFIFEPRID